MVMKKTISDVQPNRIFVKESEDFRCKYFMNSMT